MKNFIFSIFLILSVNHSYGQVSISQEKYNALKEIEKIPAGMSYDEFLKIQRELNLSKMFIATIVPGYIHFYINHTKAAWIILSTRVIGYGLITYAAVDQYNLLNNIQHNLASVTEKQERQNRNASLFASGVLLNIVGLFYDLAAGSIIIESERNEVYYKYGLTSYDKIDFGLAYNVTNNYPKISIRYNF
jgi:hypothetical protein